MGVSLRDLRRLTFEEFHEVYLAWQENEERRERAAWERMRQLAAINVAPHTSKTIAPRDLLHFPWDAETGNPAPVKMSRAEQEERFKKLSQQNT